MNKDRNLENMSSFIDAESKLEVEADNQLLGCWERYHIIGDAIRNNAPEIVTGKVVACVREKLADDPPILAPNNILSFINKKRLAITAGIVGAVALGVPVWLNQSADLSKVKIASSDIVADNTHIVIENDKKIERLNDSRINSYITRHDASALKSKLKKAPHIRVVSYPE